MSDRVLIPLGNRLLCLPWDVFESGLREGAMISGEIKLPVALNVRKSPNLEVTPVRPRRALGEHLR
jgi:hypothetical protein